MLNYSKLHRESLEGMCGSYWAANWLCTVDWKKCNWRCCISAWSSPASCLICICFGSAFRTGVSSLLDDCWSRSNSESASVSRPKKSENFFEDNVLFSLTVFSLGCRVNMGIVIANFVFWRTVDSQLYYGKVLRAFIKKYVRVQYITIEGSLHWLNIVVEVCCSLGYNLVVLLKRK
jgi:hypothetical protein